MKASILFAIAGIAGAAQASDPTPFPGDIAFTCFNSDDADEFSFVLLRDFLAGEVISFTDNGIFADGSQRATEGSSTYSFGAFTAAGTVVSGPVGSMQLSTSGDQITASINGTYIAQVDFNSTDFIEPTSSNETNLAPGLIEGWTAFNFGETDNGTYVGTRVGTLRNLRIALADESNWLFSDDRVVCDPTVFTIIPTPAAGALAGLAGVVAVARRRR